MIKFRVWDREREKMYMPTGNLELENSKYDGSRIAHFLLNGKNDFDCSDAEDCEISQFTGLIDKNNVEIYEGDFYREGDYVFICTWVQERACFGWLTSEEREAYEAYSGCIPDDWSSMEFEDCKKIVIAGNIFQKPSVLTEHL